MPAFDEINNLLEVYPNPTRPIATAVPPPPPVNMLNWPMEALLNSTAPEALEQQTE